MKNFTFGKHTDGKIYYRMGTTMEEVKGSPERLAQLATLCQIREVARELIDRQRLAVTDEILQPHRQKLITVYDEYVSKYGSLNSKSARELFDEDADYPLLIALEKESKGEEDELGNVTFTYAKSDIFFKRTVNAASEIKDAETIEEAMQISLDRKGKPDIPYIATLLDAKYPDLSTKEVVGKVLDELLEKGMIFRDPEKEIIGDTFSGLVERSEYLSGNVRKKLFEAIEAQAEARNADPENTSFKGNIEALQEIIPDNIRAEEIEVRMGANWIDPEDYTKFLQFLADNDSYSALCHDVSYSPLTGDWSILAAGSKRDLNINESRPTAQFISVCMHWLKKC
jgi:N12 class adenine-specific DNA methylase